MAYIHHQNNYSSKCTFFNCGSSGNLDFNSFILLILHSSNLKYKTHGMNACIMLPINMPNKNSDSAMASFQCHQYPPEVLDASFASAKWRRLNSVDTKLFPFINIFFIVKSPYCLFLTKQYFFRM